VIGVGDVKRDCNAWSAHLDAVIAAADFAVITSPQCSTLAYDGPPGDDREPAREQDSGTSLAGRLSSRHV
jgi:hypothetical protein